MIANYSSLRAKATKWLNGSRDFQAGLQILQEAKFRPSVVGVLARHGADGPSAKERLVYHMRAFVKLWFDKSLAEDTDLSLSVCNGQVIVEQATPAEKPALKMTPLMSDEMKARLDKGEFPLPVTQLIDTYRKAYVSREKAMAEMAALPEDNNADTVEARKKLSDSIEEYTDFLDKAYTGYAHYCETGALPEAPKDSDDKTKRVNLEDGLQNLDGMDKTALQKLRKSISTKIGRARNMLDFQTETKGSEPNPMPDGAKRVKYESKIERLSAELERVDIAIAKLA